MKKADLFFLGLLLPIDFLMFFSAALAAYFLRVSQLSPWGPAWRPILFEQSLPLSRYFELSLAAVLILLFIFALSGLYRPRMSRGHFVREIFQVAIAVCAGFLGLVLYIFLSRRWFDSRFILLAGWILGILFVSLGRVFLRGLHNHLVAKYGWGADRVLLIGQDQMSQQIKYWARKIPQGGYRLVKQMAFLDLAQIEQAVKNPQIDTIVLSSLNCPYQDILNLIGFCHEKRLKFKFVPNLLQTTISHLEHDNLGTVPLLEIKRTPLDGWARITKRCLDIFLSMIFLISASLLMPVVALAIKWDSAGPIFVKLKRVSQGKEFYLYKFRSMIKDAHQYKNFLMVYNERKDGPLFKMKQDPRITRVGRFLRWHHLDEIPQVFNVLSGKMSLVGPRPHEPQEIARYQKSHRKTLFLRPGITGLAQVSGASDLAFEQEMKLDSFYIENWALGLDLKILAKTFIRFFYDSSAA